jgi:hypothetical protein
MTKPVDVQTVRAGNSPDAKLVQVKVSVKPEVAAAFKTACMKNNVSMASILSDFMSQYAGRLTVKGGYSANLSTRRQRRSFTQSLIRQLERVRDNEECYRDNIPDNLQGGSAFDSADQCVSILEEALDLLASAYWYH